MDSPEKDKQPNENQLNLDSEQLVIEGLHRYHDAVITEIRLELQADCPHNGRFPHEPTEPEPNTW